MAGKLGKRPATVDPRDLQFSRYVRLPTPPASFSDAELVSSWGMLGNDSYGDCVWAGAAHETMIWTRESEQSPDADFTTESVLADYAAATGFDPNDPTSDRGTNMRDAAKYRRSTGILDAQGQRHKIGAFVKLNRMATEVKLATWLFSAVGIGFLVTEEAMRQFDQGDVWSELRGSVVGGHYVPSVGYAENGNIEVVTWGRVQQMTPQFFAKWCDEAFAYLSEEMLDQGISPEGFDLLTLQHDLAAL